MKRTVLVTGANRGIGLAIARRLAEIGNSVLLGSRDLKAGEAAAKSLRRPELDIEAVHMDLGDAEAIDAALKDIDKPGRQVDVLVNNAGVLREKPILELTDAEIGDSNRRSPGRSTSPDPCPGARNDCARLRPNRQRLVRLGLVRRGNGWAWSLRDNKSCPKRTYDTALERTSSLGQGECDVSWLGVSIAPLSP